MRQSPRVRLVVIGLAVLTVAAGLVGFNWQGSADIALPFTPSHVVASPAGSMVACLPEPRARNNPVLVVLDRKSPETVWKIVLDSSPLAVAFSEDGSRLGIGTMSGLTEVWDVGSKQRIWSTKPDPNLVFGVAFSGNSFLRIAGAICSGEAPPNSLKILDAASGKINKSFRNPSDDGEPPACVAPNECGDRAYVGSHYRGHISVFDLSKSQRLDPILWRINGEVRHDWTSRDMAISANSRRLVSAGKRLLVWDLEQPQPSLEARMDVDVLKVKIRPNSEDIVTLSSDSRLRVWYCKGTTLREKMNVSIRPTRDFALSPDGRAAFVPAYRGLNIVPLQDK